MRRLIIAALVGITLVGCSGTQNFAKKKHGHLKWIKTGGEIPQTAHEETSLAPAKTIVSEQPKQIVETPQNIPAGGIDTEVKNEMVIEPAKGQPQPPVISTVVKEEAVISETPAAKAEIKKPAVTENQKKPLMDADVKFIVALILCFFIPPISVYMYRGADSIFVLDLVLFLLWFLWLLGPWGLLGLASIVIALLVVLELL